MKKATLAALLLGALLSCRTNRLVTEHLEVTLRDGSRDTLTCTYWNKLRMDDYSMEWFLRQNGHSPKDVLSVELLRRDVRRFSRRELRGS